MTESATEKETSNATAETSNVTAETAKNEDLSDESWMIRDCETYRDEYDECTSFRGRFQQYFIYGETIDCNQWKKDYNNCLKWTDEKDYKAGKALIDSEASRRIERFRNHYKNDVWKKRSQPPTDFNKPLPEWMVKRDEATYLAQKAKEIASGIEPEKSSRCCIM